MSFSKLFHNFVSLYKNERFPTAALQSGTSSSSFLLVLRSCVSDRYEKLFDRYDGAKPFKLNT